MEDEREGGGCPHLSEGQIERIAEKAADKAISKVTDEVYRQIGKSVISKFVWAVGVVTIALAAWIHTK